MNFKLQGLKPRLSQDSVLQESIFEANIRGLKVFFMPKKGFQRKYAEMFVKYGSNDNKFVPVGEEKARVMPFGIAHFLEHKMFEKPWGDAFSRFAKAGGSANAYTGTNYTSYLFWTVENFMDNLDTLFQVVWEPYFTDQSVEKEKGIIAQEIRMYRDEPGQRLFRETMKNLFLEHPVRVDVAGTEDSIRQITKDLLYLCHENFYVPENMVLFIAGDMHPDQVFEAVDRMMAQYVRASKGAGKSIREEEPMKVAEGGKIHLPVPTPLVQIGWKVKPLSSGRELITQEVSGIVLLDVLFGKSSRFFTQVYEMGLIDDLSYSYEVWPDYAFGIVGAESPEPSKLLGLIREEFRRVRREGVDEDDFERIKRAAIGRYVSLFDSFDSCAEIQSHFSFLGEDIFSYGKIIRDLSMEACVQRIKELDENLMVEVTVEPEGRD